MLAVQILLTTSVSCTKDRFYSRTPICIWTSTCTSIRTGTWTWIWIWFRIPERTEWRGPSLDALCFGSLGLHFLQSLWQQLLRRRTECSPGDRSGNSTPCCTCSIVTWIRILFTRHVSESGQQFRLNLFAVVKIKCSVLFFAAAAGTSQKKKETNKNE